MKILSILNLVTAAILSLLALPVSADSMADCESVIRQGEEPLAYKHCIAAAKEGNPKAQVLVGMALMNGVGAFKDQDAAVGWFKQAANQNYPAGIYYLAMSQIAGLGTAMDVNSGMALMKRAAQAGEPRAKDFLTQVGEPLPENQPKKKRIRPICDDVSCGKSLDGQPK